MFVITSCSIDGLVLLLDSQTRGFVERLHVLIITDSDIGSVSWYLRLHNVMHVAASPLKASSISTNLEPKEASVAKCRDKNP